MNKRWICFPTQRPKNHKSITSVFPMKAEWRTPRLLKSLSINTGYSRNWVDKLRTVFWSSHVWKLESERVMRSQRRGIMEVSCPAFFIPLINDQSGTDWCQNWHDFGIASWRHNPNHATFSEKAQYQFRDICRAIWKWLQRFWFQDRNCVSLGKIASPKMIDLLRADLTRRTKLVK